MSAHAASTNAASLDALRRAFELQAQWGDAHGSPFTGELMRACLRDLESGGPVAAIVADWPGDPFADALPTRFAAALHAAILQGRALDLAREHPAAREQWDIERIWPLARAFLAREPDWVRAFLQSPPQTNETRRTMALLPGFLWAAQFGPLHLAEIGASAGLNLFWDQFRFETKTWSWGSGEGPRIDTEWIGPPPVHLDVPVNIASRDGCDRNPFDLSDPAQRLRLQGYVWADQPDRLARLNAAMALGLSQEISLERADAGDWLAAKLSAPLPPGATLIYHSMAWQYFSASAKAAVHAAIATAAAGADETHRLIWLRFEPNVTLGLDGPLEQISVVRTAWPGGETHLIARGDGHGRRVEHLGAQAVTLNLK